MGTSPGRLGRLFLPTHCNILAYIVLRILLCLPVSRTAGKRPTQVFHFLRTQDALNKRPDWIHRSESRILAKSHTFRREMTFCSGKGLLSNLQNTRTHLKEGRHSPNSKLWTLSRDVYLKSPKRDKRYRQAANVGFDIIKGVIEAIEALPACEEFSQIGPD